MSQKPLKPTLRRKWDNLIATEGAKMGLTDCVPFLENKGVNDILYEGLFNGRPCIVKCSRIASWSIGNEYRLLRKLWEVDPTIVAEPLAYHEGSMAFVVEEKLPGPTLADIVSGAPPSAEQANALALDLERIARALQRSGIVHRDLYKSDNFILGSNGHLKAIDLQFSVYRSIGCVDPWLRKNPKYHYVVFSGHVSKSSCLWSDSASLDYQLSLMPQTNVVVQARCNVTLLNNDLSCAHYFSQYERCFFRFYRLILVLQHMLQTNKRKRGAIAYRLRRLSHMT